MDLVSELEQRWFFYEDEHVWSFELSDWCQIQVELFIGGIHVFVITEFAGDDKATFVGKYASTLALEYIDRLKELYP